jgi:hypothetical protein
MAMGSTRPLTEMSARNIPGDQGRSAYEADNLTAVSRLHRKCGSLHVSNPMASTICCRNSITFFLLLPYFEKYEGAYEITLLSVYSLILFRFICIPCRIKEKTTISSSPSILLHLRDLTLMRGEKASRLLIGETAHFGRWISVAQWSYASRRA